MSSFWTNERISKTVNTQYVIRKLGQRNNAKLHSPLPFGEGLTELTHLDYIVLRCPRLFLILTEIGCSENIFEAIENNLDDGELPIPDLPNAMNGLALRSAALGRKFQKTQHQYHVQDLEEGAQLRFADEDVVPVSPIPRLKGASLPDAFDVVKAKGLHLWRRGLELDHENGFGEAEFERKFILTMQRIKHVHLTTIWATYTHQDYGYLLLQPYIGATLEAFMNDPPKSFKQLAFARQRLVITHWIQCLAAALEHLHDYGVMHRAIRPSNIYVDDQYHICLGPYLAQGAAADEPSEDAFRKDVYDHASPESYQMRHKLARGESSNVAMQGGGRTRRRMPSAAASQSSSHPPLTPSTVKSPQNEQFSRGRSNPTSPTWTMNNPNRFLERPSTASSSETVRVSVNVINYNPPQLERGWSKVQDAQLFPSDVFSLTTVLIKLFSFLASLASPGSGIAPAKIPEFLGKTRSHAGRGGAISDRSFHANLGQVDVWLEKLESVIGRPPPKPSRKITLGRKSSTKKDQDPETGRWQSAYTELIMLLRHGILKEPERRWRASEGHSAIDSVLRKWDLPISPCCGRLTDSVVSSSSREQSPSTTNWSDPAGSTIPSSLDHHDASMLNKGRDKHELPATQYDPSGGDYYEDDYRFTGGMGLSYDPRSQMPRRVVETMYDDSVSVYTKGRGSVVAESLHLGDMHDWPAPPPEHQDRRSMKPPGSGHHIYELPDRYQDRRASREQVAGRKQSPQAYLVAHELPDSPYRQSHSEAARSPIDYDDSDMEPVMDEMRKFRIR